MKIKWKIVLASVGVIVLLTSVIVLFSRAEMRSLVSNQTNVELSNYANMGMQVLNSSYPGDWSVKDNTLYKGETPMNENYEVIDSLTNGTKILATVFQGDTRIATNVADESGKRMVGTKASDAVINEVLKNGQTYLGTADILGKSAQTYYTPIKDVDGQIIGMWFVGMYTDVVNEKIDILMSILVGVSSVLLLFGTGISFVLGNGIGKGVHMIEDRLKHMEQGKFDFHFEAKGINRKDEIGSIVRSAQNVKRHTATGNNCKLLSVNATMITTHSRRDDTVSSGTTTPCRSLIKFKDLLGFDKAMTCVIASIRIAKYGI